MIEHHHPIVRGSASNILRVYLTNSASTPGTGLTGLSYVSTGLSISVQANLESGPVVYTVASSNLEAISALGAYSAPSTNKCRFAEIDATNSPGMYEIHLANTRFSVTNSQYIDIVIKGATNLRASAIRIPLTDLNPYDSTRAGLTALPNANAAGTGGLMINGTNTGTPTFSDGIIINQSATNGSALVVTGNGTGAGIFATGGSTGNGAVFQSGAGATGSGLLIEAKSTNGNGVTVIATGINHGMQIQGGATSGYGMYVLGRGTGSGIVVESGAGATGNGITILSSSTNGHGINVSGTGTGDGIRCTGGSTSGSGLRSTGGGTGYGGLFVSGSGASGDALRLTCNATNGSGLTMIANGNGNALVGLGGSSNGNGAYFGGGGTGSGIYAISGSGAVAHGIYALSNGTAGSGLYITGAGNYSGIISAGGSGGGSGVYFIGSGSGNGIQASGGATNGNGLYLFGQGTGHGVYLLSGTGATGSGLYAVSVATNGYGIAGIGRGTGSGIAGVATGTGHGLEAVGSSTGHGGYFASGSGATGDGIRAVAASTNGNGMYLAKTGSGKDLNATISTEVTAIKAKTDNLPTDPADASDIASSFTTVNTKLDTIDDLLDTEVAAIKAKTDNLPSDPADASDIASSFSTVNSTLSTIVSYLDTEIAAIKAKTDNLPSDPADASDIAASFATVNTKLDTIDDLIDTEVAAIKAKTDQLTFTTGAVHALTDSGAAIAPASTALSTATWTGTRAGLIDNLDVAISTRMATYTQPTGFLAATFPTTVASTTNITAGTITTVTTLTNDPTGVTTLLSRLSGTRAAYLDNLNTGGVVASQADITALNQSASRRITLQTVPVYERPESDDLGTGTGTGLGTLDGQYTIELRTFTGDGVAVNADTAPTLSAVGTQSGNLSSNLESVTNVATGVYRWKYLVRYNHEEEEIRFDASATISSDTFTMSTYTQVLDSVSAKWSLTDQLRLGAIYDKLPSSDYLSGTNSSDGSGTEVDLTKILGTTLTQGASGRIAGAFSTTYNVASPVFTVASVNQTGDSFSRIGSTGSGLTSLAPASTALSTAVWTSTIADRIDVAVSTRLAPTTAGRTLDITSGGAAGIDWSNVENPSSTVNLSGTTVAEVSSIADSAILAVWSYASRTLTAGTNIVLAKGVGVTGFNDISTTQVNAEVDTALADVGLTTTVTGRIDVAISTRLSSAGYTAPDNTGIAAIKAKTDNLPSDPADASDIATAFGVVNTKLDTIDDFLDTEVVAIKAKTDNLPSDPADQSGVEAAIVSATSGLATEALLTAVAAYVDTEVSAIKAKTDNLPTDPADQSAVEAAIVAATTGLALAIDVTAIKAKTDNLPSDPADASVIASAFTSLDTKIDTIDNLLDTEIASIKSKTDNLPADPASQSAIDAAFAGLDIPTPGEIATEVLSSGDVDGFNIEETLKLLLSALAGKLSGVGTSTLTFRAADDSKARITATINSSGRITVVLDAAG